MSKVPAELQDKIYRPGEDGKIQEFTWNRKKVERFGDTTDEDETEIDIDI